MQPVAYASGFPILLFETAAHAATLLFASAGLFFFIAGTVGLLRFPNTLVRLHAITKADNLGLGLIVLALLFQSESLWGGGKLLLIWLVALLVSSNACFLIGRWTLRHRQQEEAPHDR
jgi:multicomponent Na+:H+ antiporter subunit G